MNTIFHQATVVAHPKWRPRHIAAAEAARQAGMGVVAGVVHGLDLGQKALQDACNSVGSREDCGQQAAGRTCVVSCRARGTAGQHCAAPSRDATIVSKSKSKHLRGGSPLKTVQSS